MTSVRASPSYVCRVVLRVSCAVNHFKRACDLGMAEACRYANPDITRAAGDKGEAESNQAHHQPPANPTTAK